MGNTCTRHRVDASSAKPLVALNHVADDAIFSLAAFPGGGKLLVGDERGCVRRVDWRAPGQSLPGVWRGHTKPVTRLVVSAQQNVVISGSRDTTLRLWDEDRTDPVATLSGHSLAISGLDVDDSRSQVASGSRDCSVRLWDLHTAQQVAARNLPGNVVTGLRCIPGEPTALQASEDLLLRLWDLRTLKVATTIAGSSQIPLCCDVAPDGRTVAAGTSGCLGDGAVIRLYDLRTGGFLSEGAGHLQSVTSCSFLPAARPAGSTLLASASIDQSVRIWDPVSGACLCTQHFLAQQGLSPVTCLVHLPLLLSCQPIDHTDSCSHGRAHHNCVAAGNLRGSLHVWSLRQQPADTAAPTSGPVLGNAVERQLQQAELKLEAFSAASLPSAVA